MILKQDLMNFQTALFTGMSFWHQTVLTVPTHAKETHYEK